MYISNLALCFSVSQIEKECYLQILPGRILNLRNVKLWEWSLVISYGLLHSNVGRGQVYRKTLLSSLGLLQNCFLQSTQQKSDQKSWVLRFKAEFMKKSLVSPSRLIVEFHGCKSIPTECPSFW